MHGKYAWTIGILLGGMLENIQTINFGINQQYSAAWQANLGRLLRLHFFLHF